MKDFLNISAKFLTILWGGVILITPALAIDVLLKHNSINERLAKIEKLMEEDDSGYSTEDD